MALPGGEQLVEQIGVQILAVKIGGGPEVDGEGDLDDPAQPRLVGGHVAGGVGDDADSHGWKTSFWHPGNGSLLLRRRAGRPGMLIDCTIDKESGLVKKFLPAAGNNAPNAASKGIETSKDTETRPRGGAAGEEKSG